MVRSLKCGFLKVIGFHDITREKKCRLFWEEREPGINESWEIIVKNSIVLAATNL